MHSDKAPGDKFAPDTPLLSKIILARSFAARPTARPNELKSHYIADRAI